VKNKRVRKAMLDAGIKQNDLADILGTNTNEVSIMLKYELAVKEQHDIVDRIREWDALRYGIGKKEA
jgi:transcriptional regulator